jgi:hypothetical protein
MTQYMLSVHHGPNDPVPAPEDMQKAFRQVDAFNSELQASGAWVFGGGLHPPASATVVRAVEDGETIMTDGPYAETKEQLGGFWVVEAPDLDAALELASRASVACMGAVEVRPFQED